MAKESGLALVQSLEASLLEAEAELRDISPAEGAHGINSSDYRHMFDLFLQVKESAEAMRSDPQMFVTRLPTGINVYNDKAISAYAKLVSLAMKALSDLNRMRNQDKLVSDLLDSHTKEVAQNTMIQVANELRALIQKVDGGMRPDDIVIALKQLMYQRLPDTLHRVATQSLDSSRREYGLLQ